MFHEIDTVIVSYNRACQLHLLLESLECNASGVFNIRVAFRADEGIHQKTYQLLKERFSNVWWGEQLTPSVQDYYELFWGLVGSSGQQVAFFVDDNVMFGKLECSALLLTHLHEIDTWCVSLRLGKNVTHDGPNLDKTITRPLFHRYDDLAFSYFSMVNDKGTCHYVYEFSIDGHIYKSRELLYYVNQVDWTKHYAPNDIEGETAAVIRRGKKPTPTKVVTYENSIVTNLTINRVSEKSNTKIGINHVHQDILARNYLNGYIIDYDALDFSEVKQCHVSLPVEFKKWRC